jgi:DNA polymerase-1
LCWLAGTRARLARVNDPGADLRDGPHLTYFLHDELMVHTPRSCAGEVARLVREAARAAGRMLFPESDAAFPVTIDIVDRYADVA